MTVLNHDSGPSTVSPAMRRRIATALACAMCLVPLAACGASGTQGHVYYLNNKPEVVSQLDQLAALYTERTGITVDVLTATSGDYSTTLRSELGKSHAPTMVAIAGYDTFAAFRDHLEPLQDTDAYQLLDEDGKRNAYRIDDDVYTLPYAAEWYGIIANRAILERYVAKDYAVIATPDDITDYDTLERVTQSIDDHREDLGVDAAFSTPGLESSDTYRFTSHMSRLPLFYEYRDRNTTFSPRLDGRYLDAYRSMFDLQLHHSATAPSMVAGRNYEQVTAEFALGKAVFYPNGVWSYTQIKDNAVKDNDLMMLPYYMGIEGEEHYGPAGIYDASWAVNRNASAKDKQATLAFISWLVTDDQARTILSKDMGFAVPFTTFGDDYQPDNPLTARARAYTARGVPEVRSFTLPDSQWQDGLTDALVEYAQGTGTWDAVRSSYVDGWAREWEEQADVLGGLPQSTQFNEG